MNTSPKYANEIARLMRDPNSLRSEAEQMRQLDETQLAQLGHPAGTSLRLFAENKDCATAKLDIWLQRGTVTHSASLSDRSVIFRTAGGEKGRTMIIGGKDCRIRVRIEAVPANTSIFD